MTKITFLIKTAFLNVRRNKLLTISKFFSSLFCMFFALFMIGSYSGGMAAFTRERCNFKEAGTLKMYVAEERKALPLNPENAEHFIIYAQNDKVIFNEAYLAGVGISLTNKRYDELFENFCAKGRYISDAENECVIGNAIAEKYKIKVSDKISVGSREYTVSGITLNAGYRSSLLLCDSRELEIGCPQIFISSHELAGFGLKFEGEKIRDYFSSMSDMSNIIPIAAMCGAMMIFSVANVFNVMLINSRKNSLRVRIHRCLGASRKTVLATAFFEHLFINMSAFAAAFLLIAASKKAVLIIFFTSLEFSFSGVVSAFVLAVLLSIAYLPGTLIKENLCST